MADTFYDSQQKGIVSASMRTDDGGVSRIYVLPAPSEGNFETGATLSKIVENNCQGISTTAKQYVSDQDPKLSLTFAKIPEVLGLALGRKMTQVPGSQTETFNPTILVPTDGIVNASASGYYGFGVTANAITKASYQSADGFSVTIIQDSNFSAFNPILAGNELKFATGDNGAFKFGSGLWEKRVSLEVNVPIAGIYQLGDSFNNMSLKVGLISLDLKYFTFLFPSVSLEPGSVSLKEPQQELSFFVNGGYQLKFMKQLFPC